MPNALNAGATPAPARRRFRPRLLPTLATAVAVAVFVAAGNWQRARMHAKEALRARYDAAAQSAPAPLPGGAAQPDWSAQRYRPVVLEGEFDAARQILVDNRIHAGRAGFHVVTPLQLAGGGAVLVNRGWVQAGASRAALPSVPVPAGPVVLQGRINVADHYLELKTESPAGPLWQNLDPVRFTATTGYAVLPVVVEQTASLGPKDSLVRDWPAPDFGVEKHWMYMWQWYAFAALAVTLWLALNWHARRREVGRG